MVLPRSLAQWLYKLGEASKEMQFLVPLSTDLAHISQFLVDSRELRFVLQQNEDKYRLCKDVAEDGNFTVKITSATLKLKRIKVCDNVALAIEKQIVTTPCKYVLAGFDTRYRTIPANSHDIILDDLFTTIPSYIVLAFQNSEIFTGDMKSESFKFTHGNISEITLQVGGQQYRRNYDFTDTASLASEYYELFTHLVNRTYHYLMISLLRVKSFLAFLISALMHRLAYLASVVTAADSR